MLPKIALSTLFSLALLIPSLNFAKVDFSKLRHRNALFPHLLRSPKGSYEADLKDIDLSKLSSRLSLYPSLGRPVKAPVGTNAANDGSDRIVGGTVSDTNEFPETVAIFVDRSYFCGGIIINYEWVLTAAACVDGATSWRILAGANDLLEPSPTEQSTRGIHFEIHPEWTATTPNGNVALLRVETPFTLNDFVRSSRLASSEPDNEEPMTAVGWGFTSDSSVAVTPRQRKVGLETVTDTQAEVYYGDVVNYEHHMCVNTAGGVGPCSRDYGGPLYSSDGTVHGAMSFHAADANGAPMCTFGAPACYSSIAHFRSWIVTTSSAKAISGWSMLALLVPAIIATLTSSL